MEETHREKWTSPTKYKSRMTVERTLFKGERSGGVSGGGETTCGDSIHYPSPSDESFQSQLLDRWDVFYTSPVYCGEQKPKLLSWLWDVVILFGGNCRTISRHLKQHKGKNGTSGSDSHCERTYRRGIGSKVLDGREERLSECSREKTK